MVPGEKPLCELWHKRGQCLVAGTRLLPENFTWNSKPSALCSREDDHNEEGTGQGMKATSDGKETQPDFSSSHVPPKQVSPFRWGVENKCRIPWERVWLAITCLNRE